MTEPPAPPQSPDERQALFRAFFRTEHGYVWNSLRRLGIAERDLPDVTHDVFVALYRALPGYDTSRPIRPFLFGIAFRVASDHRRLGRNKNERLLPTDHATARELLPDEQVAASRDRALVHEALQQLEPERRAVFVLHDIDGVTVPEIARALDVPLNTAYSRLRLARQDFATAVRRLRGKESG